MPETSDPRRGGEDMPSITKEVGSPEARALPTCGMSATRFCDRFRYYNNEDQQASGVWMLYDAIRALPGGCGVLDEQAPWAVKFSEKPPAPAFPTGITADESGMVGPKKTPLECGAKAGDFLLVVNDKTEAMRCYDSNSALIWTIPCLARGQGSDYTFSQSSTDTPPGIYKAGVIYRDYDEVGANPGYSSTLQSYGWYSIDMEECEGQEARYGRAGIMTHGGGSACGWPGAWAAKQRLYPTLGCIRVYNIDLRDKIVPLCDQANVWFSVWQEKGSS
jgi:hypothetical protein